jgi:uncharacterized protein YrrD
MSTRATDIIGRPIVSADTGKKLGVVGDLLLAENGRALVGLTVKHGAFRSEDVLPIEAVQSFGTDAVVSRSEQLIGAREWRQQRQELAVGRPPHESPPR